MKRFLCFLIPAILCACSKNSVQQSAQIAEVTEPDNAAVTMQTSEAEDDVKSVYEEKKSLFDFVSEEEYLSSYADRDENSDKPEMIFVEGGRFRLGTNFKDFHNVTVSSFEIGRTEVTFGQYYPSIGKEIMESRKNYAAANINWYEAIIYCNKLSIQYGYEPCYSINGETDPSLWGNEVPYFTEAEGHVGNMNAWNAIHCNFNANGYRLPTDAEWAFAARGGNKSKNYTYSGSDNIDEVGWHKDNCKKDGQEVAKKKPNELGIYDMSGNVWEWCWDKRGVYSKKSEVNPTGPTEENHYRVIRGGGDGTSEDYCALTYIESDYPDVKSWYYGFRLCRSIGER